MKQNYLKEIMTALLLLCCTVAGAADLSFEVDGIYYHISSKEDKTVGVIIGSSKNSSALIIPESVTYNSVSYSVTSIANFAFSGYVNLTSVEIPNSVIEIEAVAFADCTGLTSVSIGNSVAYIGDNAFRNCTSLTSIEIPASVTSIGEEAFYYCTDLTSIVVDEGNTIYDSRGNCNAIIETASNTLILGCKNTIIPEGVTSIGNHAFHDCTSLTSIVIPEGVTSMGAAAFLGCDGLTSIEIPASVTSIGYEAFSYCTGLTSIKISSSVTSIGRRAFYWCSGLTSITSHIAAENLFAPGNDAFNRIDKYACTLYVPAGAKSTYAATDGWKEFKNIVEMSSDGSDATAIESVENEQQGEAVYYDLSGRRVENPAKGIYIVNGRKVFIK